MAGEKYEQVVDDFPSGWEEDCLVSSVTTNSNGTLTINIDVRVTAEDGRMWQGYRKMRLEREVYSQRSRTNG